MDGIWFQELKKVGVSPHKIFAGNTLARRERGRFFAKPPSAARSCEGVNPVNTFASETRYHSCRSVKTLLRMRKRL